MSKVSRLLHNPSLLIPYLGARGFFHKMDDKSYLEKCFNAYLGYELDLNNPMSFNEKLQWLKLNDRNPLYTKLVDKYEAKLWVADKIGDNHIVNTLGLWDTFDEINFDALPDRFVLKCTHDSGGLAICRNKANFDLASAKKKIDKSLKRNYYWQGREWPYKDVKPRIIAEEFLDTGESDLIDYKFYCFDGVPKFLYVSAGMESHETARVCFLDTKWNPINIERTDYKKFDVVPDKPDALDDMLRIAKVLSAGIPHVRVDLYDISGTVYFSEMTFSTNSGFIPFTTYEADLAIGQLLSLPIDKIGK